MKSINIKIRTNYTTSADIIFVEILCESEEERCSLESFVEDHVVNDNIRKRIVLHVMPENVLRMTFPKSLMNDDDLYFVVQQLYHRIFWR